MGILLQIRRHCEPGSRGLNSTVECESRVFMSDKRTVILAGGGTGGHLTPGLAVVQELRRRDPAIHVVFVGSDRPIDQKLLTGHDRRVIAPLPLQTAWRSPGKFVRAWWRARSQSWQLLEELHPPIVIGLGGLASVPVLLAAQRRGIPTLLLEQNVIPGRANRWLARHADRVCVSFAETLPNLPHPGRGVVTGNPVRPEFAALAMVRRDEVVTRPSVLILGGSQGAQPLNTALAECLREVPPAWRAFAWVHQSGESGVAELQAAYGRAGLAAEVAPFLDDLDRRLPSAAVVISRAGATTLAELACAGVATVLVPYPQAADDHQRANARAYSARGGAVVVDQEGAEPFPRRLGETLLHLLDDPPARHGLARQIRSLAHPDAAARVVDEIDELASRRAGL